MNEPIGTLLVVLATCGIAIWAFENPLVQDRLMFRPQAILAGKEHYRLLTSCFPHCGGWQHLFFNMYALYGFGGVLERLFGPGHMLILYFGSVLGGNLFSLYLHHYHDYAAAGASGGVCGLIFAFILWRPVAVMTLFPLPFYVPAWLYAIAFMAASFYAMKVAEPTIAHDAHLGGAISGLLLIAGLHPEVVRRHWIVFLLLLFAAGLVFAYVHFNPLFLPLSSFRSGERGSRPRKTTTRNSQRKSASNAANSTRLSLGAAELPQADWLIEQIEVHVGKLTKDPSGLHDWIDKFGRTYDVVGGNGEHFDLNTFRQALLDHLNTPSVRFVILDARKLKPAHIALLRPFIADLPDAQFSRIIRSYGFTSH